ncbi:hypothetical protein BKA80DRAFT_306773 [Phyllosticta citrichinensis]
MASEQAPTVCSAITASQHVRQDSTLALSNSPFGTLPNEIILTILEYVECDTNFSKETLSIPPNAHWNPSQQFLDILPKLTSLRTFSLRVEAFEDYPTSAKFVEEVLRLLPDSVTSLELDTGCSRRNQRRVMHFHICEALGRIMPRLQNLSLRTKYVCEALFGMPRPGDEPKVCFPRLERLLIEIPSVHMPQPECHAERWLYCGYHFKTQTPRAYLPDIRRMKERGAFPALIDCTIYFRKCIPPVDPEVLTRTNCGFHLLINVLQEASLIVPYLSQRQYYGARVLSARRHDGVAHKLDDEFSRLPIFGFWNTLRNGVRSPEHHDHEQRCGCHLFDLFLPERPEQSNHILHEPRPERRWPGLSTRSVLFEGAMELHTEYGFVPPGYDVRYIDSLFRVLNVDQAADNRPYRFRVGGGGMHVHDDGTLTDEWSR